MVKYYVLIIDDSPEDRETYRSLLCSREECEFDFTEASTAGDGLKIALSKSFDCILIDYAMPDASGLQVIERYVSDREHPSPVVMVTGRGDERIAVQALKSGAADYIVKSELNSDAIYRAVHNAIDKGALQRALDESNTLLREAKDRAERASAAKSIFLANMSHEIRTPLSAILGFSELISRGNLSPEQIKRFSMAIYKNGETLMQILNDVLDLSKIEAGKLSVETAAVEIHQLLTDVKTMFDASAIRKKLTLSLQISPRVPRNLMLDPTRLRQVLFNLLSNAIKFTDQGDVAISADYADGEIAFEVHDTGIGIEVDQVNRLFEAFQQGDETTTRRFGGTGLGLLLARRLAEAMGGRVELIRTRLGVGSVFGFRIPAPLGQSERPIYKVEAVKLNALDILVVEDSEDARTFVTHVLREAGAHVDAAEDGAIGLSMASARHYDVIISDLRMPGLDGLELARCLRKVNFDGFLLGLSAHAFAEDRHTALTAGFDDFLSKPVNTADLCSRILERRRRTVGVNA